MTDVIGTCPLCGQSVLTSQDAAEFAGDSTLVFHAECLDEQGVDAAIMWVDLFLDVAALDAALSRDST